MKIQKTIINILIILFLIMPASIFAYSDNILENIDSEVSNHRPVNLSDKTLLNELQNIDKPINLLIDKQFPDIVPEELINLHLISINDEFDDFEIFKFEDIIKDSLNILPTPPDVPEK